ncbi:uncharacterized protein LOC134247018 [Saccostrea cucullata]|uniref:uncharacterized protein LOC134247018 n=1 Tax=Saccostrea cuccullata TaxID=36930 RepID=UPI002ED6BC58
MHLCIQIQMRKTFIGTQNCVEDTTYEIPLQTEIFKWRQHLRNSNYLNPSTECRHTSLNGIELDEELLNFAAHCKANRASYHKKIAQGQMPGKGHKLIPIFIFPKDRSEFHKIERKTVREISDMVLSAISEIRKLGSIDTASILLQTWHREKLSTAKKDVILSFYKECVVALEEATFVFEGDEVDSEESAAED